MIIGQSDSLIAENVHPLKKNRSVMITQANCLILYFQGEQTMQTLNEKGILDYTGATISWICAFHCLAMPLLITALPIAGLSFLTDEKTELLIISFSVIIALIAFIPATYKHRKIHPILFFGLGMTSVFISHFFFEDELIWRLPTVLCGAIFITTAHLLNRHHSKCCKVCSKTKQV